VEAEKLVGPPGPTYRMAFPAFSAATPSAKELTTVASGAPLPIFSTNGCTLGVGAVRGDHGQRREIDSVVEVHRTRGGQIGVEITGCRQPVPFRQQFSE